MLPQSRQVSYSPLALGQGTSQHHCETNACQLLDKNKNKHTIGTGKLQLSCQELIEVMKRVRCQSLNFTSELKGYPFQTTELKEELIVLTGKCDETMEPKEEVNSLSLKMVKLIVKMIIFHSLFFQTSYHSTLLLCTSLKWSLNYSGYPLYIILCSY